MIRLLDPFGLVAGTWDHMGAYSGDGFGALVATELVVCLHLLAIAAVLRPFRAAGAVRGFVQYVREHVPQAPRPT
jgi:hypothetical protein